MQQIKRQIFSGCLLWASTFLFIDVSLIDRLLLFAILVIVPLTLRLTETVDRHGRPFRMYTLTLALYPFAVVGVIVSFVVSSPIASGLWALVWCAWTACVSLYGLSRLIQRGFSPMEELSIDVGLLFLTLGGGWFVVSQFGWD
ncbi:MAG: YndJ family transporter, partial [Bacilli bacterium]